MIDLNLIDPPPVRYDLDEIVRRLRGTAERWVPDYFRHGRRDGNTWRLANIQGDPPRHNGSCIIALRGEHAGDWHDFDGGDGGGPLSTLEHGCRRSGTELYALAADLVAWSPAAPPQRQAPPPPAPERDPAQDVAFVLERAAPIAGTPAEAYLHGRGLTAPPQSDLAYHPDLADRESRRGYDGLVGIVRDLAGQIIGLQRIYLAPDSEQPDRIGKAPIASPRKMLGRMAGGTVRLAPIRDDGLLALSEGIETGLAAMTACPGVPVWAALSTTGLEQVRLPPEARRVLILADHDASGAGLRAAEAAASILRGQGRAVAITLPAEPGQDINDVLLRAGPEAVAALIGHGLALLSPAPAPQAEPETGRHQPFGFVEPASQRPMLRVDEGDLARATRRAWRVVHASNAPPWLYRLGGEPTWIVPDDDGRPVTATVREERLRHMLARLADWRRAGPNETLVPAPPPTGLMKSLVVTPDPALPVLGGIVTAPVFGRGGVLLTEPGYHPDARLLYCPAPGFRLPPVPDRPSPQEIAAARTLLVDDLLGDFPFVSEAERAHVLALLLLGFVRPMVAGATPLHLIEKPTPGTGATLMVDAVAMILTGSSAAVMAEGRDEDEWRKRLTAKLRQLPTLLLIDNLRRELDSSALAAALTAPFWEDRVLGVSEMTRLPVRCVWIATGNNPSFSNEIARRLVRIRLDAQTDQPWRREGFRHPDLMGWVQANRGALVAACLTLCRAWIVAGRPRGERSIGSFESWAHTIGGILGVAGIGGFLGNLDHVMQASDKEGPAWGAFIQTWWDRFGSAEVSVSDLVGFAQAAEPALPIASKADHGFKVAFGMALRKLRDRAFRISDRLVRVRFGGVQHNAQRWRLEPAQDAATVGASAGRLARPSEGSLFVSGESFSERLPSETAMEINAVGSLGSLGSLFPTPLYVRTHARVKEGLEKDSQDSQDSPTPGNASVPGWESSGESSSAVPQRLPPPAWLDGVP
jgi:hypothetical protein